LANKEIRSLSFFSAFFANSAVNEKQTQFKACPELVEWANLPGNLLQVSAYALFGRLKDTDSRIQRLRIAATRGNRQGTRGT
jgi:hypothetical protein